jgi:Trp operon repressor
MANKENVVIFDDGSIEAQYLETQNKEAYNITKIKVKEFSKGKLREWLDQVKGGDPEKKQKVFLGFSNEFVNANEIIVELRKIESEYPNLSISSMLDGMDKDSILKRLGIETTAQKKARIAAELLSGKITQKEADKELGVEAKEEVKEVVETGSTSLATETVTLTAEAAPETNTNTKKD